MCHFYLWILLIIIKYLAGCLLEHSTNAEKQQAETFESQKQIVTTKIIPALLKVIDPETYPIGEGILYEMIHQYHHHQREETLKK